MHKWMMVVVMWLSGCSFMFASGPPARHQEQSTFDCTESRAAPVVDTALAALQSANLVIAMTSSNQQWADRFDGKPPLERATAVPVYIAAALVATASAAYGYSKTRACREAKDEAMIRAQNADLARRSWQTRPPPPGALARPLPSAALPPASPPPAHSD